MAQETCVRASVYRTKVTFGCYDGFLAHNLSLTICKRMETLLLRLSCFNTKRVYLSILESTCTSASDREHSSQPFDMCYMRGVWCAPID